MGIISFGRYSAHPTEDLCVAFQPTVINELGTVLSSLPARSAVIVNPLLELTVLLMRT